MKIRNLFFASLAALTFAACSNDDAPVPEGAVNFSVASVGAITKATSPSVGAEGALTSTTIYVYNAEGTSLVTSINASATGEKNTVTSNLPVAKYQVAVVANATLTSESTSTLENLEKSVIDLSATKESFVLFGKYDGALDVTIEGAECKVSLERLVAGVQMGTITFKLDDNVETKYLDAVNNGRVELVSISLKESFNKAVLGTGVHSGETVIKSDAEGAALLNATYGTKIGSDKIIAAPSEYEPTNRVYGYAGTPLNVQLVVKYTFGDAQDSEFELKYYNVENETEFIANTLYTINATLTREGSSDPDKKGYGVKFILKAAEWNTGNSIEAEVGN